ncbi:putative FERM domain-containing protein FRMD8P1 isoform X2 [Tubulanus polymorphus]|uniref:putative FERM domain-containing protein FRMD8P1 isoform X2 n=1 Tax=Tubulanus polymorphus TaxID=672921 RepID=UPI003DA68C47
MSVHRINNKVQPHSEEVYLSRDVTNRHPDNESDDGTFYSSKQTMSLELESANFDEETEKYDNDDGNASSPPKPRQHDNAALEMCVYLMDNTGVQLTVEDGRNATAAEILEMLEEESGLPEETNCLFALWLVSPLLELQLKPHHSPFHVTIQWDELLQKYSTADDDEIERDEPVLTLRRRVSVPRSYERTERHPLLRRLLYYEAVYNVANGRYPIESEDYHRLAGIQITVEHGKYDAKTHDEKFYKDNVDDCYPEHVFSKSGWSSCTSKQSPHTSLLHHHQQVSTRFNEFTEPVKYQLMMDYLEFCWTLPHYGCAFFHGQTEKPMNAFLASFTNGVDIDVLIGINRDGIYVIDPADVSILVGLLYKELSWEFSPPGDETNRNCIPCLFLQFREDPKKQSTRLLQIFSRQARMMDALIESCVNQLTDSNTDDVNGSAAPAKVIS